MTSALELTCLYSIHVDIPAIDSIVMARPTKSNVLFQQMLGRGMRLYAGKEDCHVLDFVDAVQGEALVSAPTLLGLDPEAVFNSKSKVFSFPFRHGSSPYCLP